MKFDNKEIKKGHKILEELRELRDFQKSKEFERLSENEKVLVNMQEKALSLYSFAHCLRVQAVTGFLGGIPDSEGHLCFTGDDVLVCFDGKDICATLEYSQEYRRWEFVWKKDGSRSAADNLYFVRKEN